MELSDAVNALNLSRPSLTFAICPVSAGQARNEAALPEGRRPEPQSGERVPERCISYLRQRVTGSLSWNVFVKLRSMDESGSLSC